MSGLGGVRFKFQCEGVQNSDGSIAMRMVPKAQRDAAQGEASTELSQRNSARLSGRLSGSSEINANPADTADHPFGVWTLPPASRTTDRDGNAPEGFDPAAYAAIGESDRMTMKFVKPDATDLEPVE